MSKSMRKCKHSAAKEIKEFKSKLREQKQPNRNAKWSDDIEMDC